VAARDRRESGEREGSWERGERYAGKTGGGAHPL
jgi:hypothetical protein